MFESTLMNFPGSLFGEFERLRRELDDFWPGTGLPSSIRSAAPGSFPALNVGRTPSSVEVYAFAPGIDASSIEVTIDRGVLRIAGERPQGPAESSSALHVYGRERPSGKFMRAISLPEDADPDRVDARYRDGVLQISIARREAVQPKRISVN